jgi:hypothetical protein
MAALGNCSLCRLPNYIQKKLENNKRPFLVYSIFLVLIIEWFSIIYLNFHKTTEKITDFYVVKLYPFLTQFVLFIIFLSLFLWKEKLRFCSRKSASTFYLSMYYLFGCFAIIFCMQASLYYLVLSFSSLALASLLLFVSFLKTK